MKAWSEHSKKERPDDISVDISSYSSKNGVRRVQMAVGTGRGRRIMQLSPGQSHLLAFALVRAAARAQVLSERERVERVALRALPK